MFDMRKKGIQTTLLAQLQGQQLTAVEQKIAKDTARQSRNQMESDRIMAGQNHQ
jgi:hypothetical protein